MRHHWCKWYSGRPGLCVCVSVCVGGGAAQREMWAVHKDPRTHEGWEQVRGRLKVEEKGRRKERGGGWWRGRRGRKRDVGGGDVCRPVRECSGKMQCAPYTQREATTPPTHTVSPRLTHPPPYLPGSAWMYRLTDNLEVVGLIPIESFLHRRPWIWTHCWTLMECVCRNIQTHRRVCMWSNIYM